MSTTPRRKVTYVAEGVIDQAPAINDALRQIDGKFVPIVLEMGIASASLPTTGLVDGDMYVIDSADPTYPNYIAQYVEEGDFWQYYPPEDVGVLLNIYDGGLYSWDYSSPGDWQPATAVVTSVPPPEVVTDANATRTLAPSDAGTYIRFTHAAPEVVVDDAEGYTVGEEYHLRYQGAGSLTLSPVTGFTINPPADGTLEVPAGGTVTLKIVAAGEADLMGLTVPA